MKDENRKTCNNHCRGCGQHFHGLTAFDAHRVKGYCEDGPEVLLVRGTRAGSKALQVWTQDGWCEHEKGCYVNGKFIKHVGPVTIYNGAGRDD
jgi:hypothetical protein